MSSEVEECTSREITKDEPTTSNEKLDVCSTISQDSGHDSTGSNMNSQRRSLISLPLRWHNTNGATEGEPLIGVGNGKSTEFLATLGDASAWQNEKCMTDFLGSKNSLVSSLSATSSHTVLCRICHVDSSTPRDPLVSPCRCSGSMLYVHKSCLVHWLELSTRKMVPEPRCELCGYNYKRSNYICITHFHFPHMALRDAVLNILFVIVFSIMCICGFLSIHFLKLSEQNHQTVRGYRVVNNHLNQEDWIVIFCSILFFSSFFVAIFTQYRAEASIFRFFFRFWVINRNWTIRNYDISEDPEMLVLRERRQRDNGRVAETQTKTPSPVPSTKIQPTMTV